MNPNNETCNDGDCINKLIWDSDGSSFNSWVGPSHDIKVNGPEACLRYESKKMNDVTCTATYYYICEFKC